MGRYESGHTFVQSRLLRPKKPILYCGTESIDVEPRYQRRIQVRQLILLAVIDSRDKAAAFREGTPCKFTVKRQVHDGLEHLGAGSVQFVQEKHHRLSIGREPVWRHEIGLSGFAVLRWQADEVAWVGHLAQKQCDDFHSLRLEIAGQDLGLADAVTAGKHDVLRSGHSVENPP